MHSTAIPRVVEEYVLQPLRLDVLVMTGDFGPRNFLDPQLVRYIRDNFQWIPHPHDQIATEGLQIVPQRVNGIEETARVVGTMCDAINVAELLVGDARRPRRIVGWVEDEEAVYFVRSAVIELVVPESKVSPVPNQSRHGGIGRRRGGEV